MANKNPCEDPLLTPTDLTHQTNERSGWFETKPAEWRVYIKKHKLQPVLLKFGAGGHTVEFEGGQTSLHGYERQETYFSPSKWWAHDFAEMLSTEQYEGVPYINMRVAVESEDDDIANRAFKMAIKGPMCDVTLAPGEVARCPEPSQWLKAGLAMEADRTGDYTFASLLALQHAQEGQAYGALDSVDIVTFSKLWQDAGAEVGQITDGEFVAITNTKTKQ